MAKPSFVAVPDVVACREDLTAADKLVYGSMLGYQGRFYHCFASLAKIGARVGLNEKTARRAIKALVAAGVVEPVMVHTVVSDKEIQFQQRGGKAKLGRTKCWRCLEGLPRATVECISRPRRVK